MLVSVIIPLYNAAPYIAATLQSLKDQTLQDFEALLVDDHGKDNSVEVARETVGEDPRFRFLQTEKNAGPGVARNVGLEAAQGEFVAFLDSDDLWEPTFLEKLVAASCSLAGGLNPETSDLAYCQLQYRNPDGSQGETFRNPVVTIKDATEPEGYRQKIAFMSRFVTYSVCFLYRRQFVEEHHLRFPNQRSSEDTNFLVKALLYAHSLACVDEPLYVYCLHGESLTQRQDETRYLSKMAAMEQLLDECQQMPAEGTELSSLYGQYWQLLDYLYIKKGYAISVLNYLKSVPKPEASVIRELRARMEKRVPEWRRNPLLVRDKKTRLVCTLFKYTRVCVWLLPKIIKNKKQI